jgi:hypothetical protein
MTTDAGQSRTQQGDLALLQDPIAQHLLHARIPARLAYTWTDGTPRLVPIWFHWTGDEFVLATPPRAPRLKALRANPAVALSVDDTTWPYKVLLVRGRARLEPGTGVVPEYELAVLRYFGEDQGRAWLEQIRVTGMDMVRVAIRPECVGILDYHTRFPKRSW